MTKPPLRSVRPMWMFLATVIAIAFLGFGTLQALGRLAHGSESVVSTFDGAISTIEISVDRGSVRLVGSPSRGGSGGAPAVEVTAQVDHGLFETHHSAELVGGSVVLDASCPRFPSSFCSVDYVVEVPQGVAVIADVERGRISVGNLRGSIELSTRHGDVELDRITGDVKVSTRHGDVRGVDLAGDRVVAGSEHGDVSVELVRTPLLVDARSSHGDVEVVVPDASGPYAVDLSTDRGDTSSSVRTDPGAERHIDVRSNHGDVTVRYP